MCFVHKALHIGNNLQILLSNLVARLRWNLFEHNKKANLKGDGTILPRIASASAPPIAPHTSSQKKFILNDNFRFTDLYYRHTSN